MNNISMLHSYIAKGQELIYIKDLAKMLGLQPQTIRKWISQDRLPPNLVKPKKQGNRNVWHIDKVMHYLQSIKN